MISLDMLPTLRALGMVAGVLVCSASAAEAQAAGGAVFRARLTPVPVETATASSITGSGLVMATLSGTRLSVSGTFAGMKSAATLAQVHLGAKGIRGPVEFDLMIEKAAGGELSGNLTLTKVQLDSLKKGWYYIQIHAEKAPEGNLWGWLLPDEK
jgi:hypothetical protein